MPLTQKDKRKRQDSETEEATRSDHKKDNDTLIENSNKQTQLLSQILEVLVDLKEDIKVLKEQNNVNNEKITETLQSTSNNLKEQLTSFCQSQVSILQEISNNDGDDLGTKRFPNWQHFLNSRKVEFWKYFKNKKMSEIYTKWKDSTPTLIPRKFKPKEIRGEADGSKQVRLEMAKNKMTCEVQILKIKSDDGKIQYEAIDRQVHQMIDEKLPNNLELRTKYKTKWAEQCHEEEEKSEVIFEKKQNWYENQELNGANESNNTIFNNDNSEKPVEAAIASNFRRPRPPTRNYNPNYGSNRAKPKRNNNNNNHMRNKNQSRQLDQQHQMERQNSITEEITDNFPATIPRTFSDSFLPRGRPPNEALD